MNPGGSGPSLGSTPSKGGSTGAGGSKAGFDAKAQAISQADNMLEKYVSDTPDVGEKVGLSKQEAQQADAENREAEANGEPQAQPSAPRPGEKIGDGKQVNEKGEVEKTATRKLVGAAGTAVATYYGGAKGAELASQIDNSKTGNAVLGKVSDIADKVPGVEQASKDLEGASEAVTGAAGAYVAAKNGNYGEAIKQAKQAKKGLSKQQKVILKRIIIASLPAIFFFLILITIIILPFEGGYNVLNDFMEGASEGAQNVWDWITGGGDDEMAKAIVGDVPGWDSLSTNRKKIVTAAALAVGAPYKGGGRPTDATVNGISGGVDAGGLAEWVIWNVSGSDPGYLSGSNIAGSSLFESISESDLKPGDFGVNGDDVGIYMGNGQWVHVDPSQGVIRGSYNGFTQFYRYKDAEGGGSGGGGGGTKPVSKECSTMTSSLFPGGIPKTQAEISKYLTTVTVAVTTKSGQKKSQSLTLHSAIASDVVKALQDAQNAGFKVYDVQSMRGWNRCSTETGGATCGLTMSQHCYGLAVDINVAENPFVASANPYASSEFAINHNTQLYKSFVSLGWGWGGDWKQAKKDYMHFSYMGT